MACARYRSSQPIILPDRPFIAFHTYKICIIKTFMVQFDNAKNIANQRKHKGVSLADAEPVFYDEAALAIQDHDHGEERWVIMGTDANGVPGGLSHERRIRLQ
ncbi:BrnT family toxin [Pseudomonas lactis]|uniref:BrnT family toxin n=1 Tax=Pseudomonas lactis TaxID=1615674 RepID=UPI003F81C36C